MCVHEKSTAGLSHIWNTVRRISPRDLCVCSPLRNALFRSLFRSFCPSFCASVRRAARAWQVPRVHSLFPVPESSSFCTDNFLFPCLLIRVAIRFCTEAIFFGHREKKEGKKKNVWYASSHRQHSTTAPSPGSSSRQTTQTERAEMGDVMHPGVFAFSRNVATVSHSQGGRLARCT